MMNVLTRASIFGQAKRTCRIQNVIHVANSSTWSQNESKQSNLNVTNHPKPFPISMSHSPMDGSPVKETLGIVTSTSVMSRNIFVDVAMEHIGSSMAISRYLKKCIY